MYTEKLEAIKDKYEIKVAKIKRLLDDKKAVEEAISDLEYLKKHAGTMLFQGRTGKIGDEVMLRTIKINTLSGCVAVPKLLSELALKRLAEIEHEADVLSSTEEGL